MMKNNSIIEYRTEVCIYNRYGVICMVLNPWGRYWNIWLISDEMGMLYRGTCFHRDMWYCIFALIMTEGRK